jgi:hypothetical protein
MNSITSAIEKNGADGRVVTDLLSVHGAAINNPLKSLSKDGVERFVDVEVNY